MWTGSQTHSRKPFSLISLHQVPFSLEQVGAEPGLGSEPGGNGDTLSALTGVWVSKGLCLPWPTNPQGPVDSTCALGAVEARK